MRKLKTLKDYISAPVAESQPTEKVDEYTLEALDAMYGISMESLQEDKDGKGMPAILMMRRKSFRQFPDGQKVALYYIDKLDKYVTVPYGGKNSNKNLTLQPGSSVKETVFHHLNHIVESDVAKSVSFDDGSTKRVDVYTAEAILKVYNSLNRENKTMIEEMAQKSKDHFNKVVDFAHKQFK
jgi:hypothetical protein